MSILII